MLKPDPFAPFIHGIKHRPQAIKDEYLADWYIGVAKKTGWDAVLMLLDQNPQTSVAMKKLIKQRYRK